MFLHWITYQRVGLSHPYDYYYKFVNSLQGFMRKACGLFILYLSHKLTFVGSVGLFTQHYDPRRITRGFLGWLSLKFSILPPIHNYYGCGVVTDLEQCIMLSLLFYFDMFTEWPQQEMIGQTIRLTPGWGIQPHKMADRTLQLQLQMASLQLQLRLMRL